MTGLCLTRRVRYKAVGIEPEKKTGHVPCPICGSPVSRKKGVDIGHGLFRHKRCKAGSKRWLAHRQGDPFYRYFVTGPDKGVAMTNGIKPMKDGEAGEFRGPDLDDYLRVRAVKHDFGRSGRVIDKNGDRGIPAEDMIVSARMGCLGAL
ncbi:MAG: hypothetical protein WCP22_03250 [Chlamydiota bacterium]